MVRKSLFRINSKEEGYEVRNAEKGGLVAIIDNMGNFKMLSADESRAEMGRTKGEETDYMQQLSIYITMGITLFSKDIKTIIAHAFRITD